MLQVISENASGIIIDVLYELTREDDPRWHEVGPRGMSTREITDVYYRLENVDKCATWLPGRNLNYSFMVAEWVWIWAGRDDVEMIKYYNKNIEEFADVDEGKRFFGAYGPRWRGQIGGVIHRLRRDTDSRQGVLVLWRQQYNRERHVTPNAPYMDTRDVPCTLVMQYRVRQGKLECSVCMRSSDTWLGLPYDIFNFAMLQRSLAAELEISTGHLGIFIGSSHLYERNLEQAKKLLERWDDPQAGIPDQFALTMPPAPRVYGVADVMDIERNMRESESFTYNPPKDWGPWLSMLHYRQHRAHELVQPELQKLVTP
jgi:thymidylate synthase